MINEIEANLDRSMALRWGDVLGITEEIEKSGRYEPLRPRIWRMDHKTQADEIRRLAAEPT